MIRTEMDALAATLARILIGGFFALSGANNLLNIQLATDTLAEAGVPIAPFFIVIAAFFKLVLGILIMVKHHTKLASFFLILYLTISSLLFYNPLQWEEFPTAETIFMRNLAILGGLLFLYAHSRGLTLMRSDEVGRMASRKVADDEYA